MGLFSWIFKKKAKEPKEPDRHLCEDMSNKTGNVKSTDKIEAEIIKSEPAKTRPITVEVKKEEPAAPAPAPKKTAEPVKAEQKKAAAQPAKAAPKKPAEPAKDEVAATEIAEDKNAETVKVKGFGGAFDIKKSRDGRYVFNLYAANRVIVATSQIYSSSQSAITGIKSVIANAERANVEDQTLKQYQPQPYPKWEIYVDKGGQYRWRLLATNGSCILHSQGYTQKSTCKKGIESVIRTAKSAKIDKSYLEK